ncbi:T9SS type A sorting domain-containing protein [Chryseobacterium sp. Mn2064]|uniref:T9SS type A sorting domain-containing protein n=1 Tax=Chryseobacterium sp. Mn2064 TaxID=3395263 RepID=UPI003BE3F8B8
MKKISFLVFALVLNGKVLSQTYQVLNLTGFNADVIGNGVGPVSGSTNASLDKATDNFAFISKDFQLDMASPVLTYGLPSNGAIDSNVSSTPNLSFQLASYSSNNSLRLPDANMAGNLTVNNPAAASVLYMLSVSGSGPSTGEVTVNFNDGSSQVFSGVNFQDWYNGNDAAIQGIGRIHRVSNTLDNAGGNNPRIYQTALNINAEHQNKKIISISIKKTSSSDTVINVFGFTVREPQPSQVCSGGDPGNNSGDVGCVNFQYGGQSVAYHTVRGADGRIWLQQNLGSTKVASNLTDEDAYGDFFQWGRWVDGHQVRSSAINGTSPSPNNPQGLSGGSASFYSAGYNSGANWWSNGVPSDQWNASNISSVSESVGVDPCQAIGNNWRLPSKEEVEEMLNAENITEYSSALNSNLKLIPAGMKDYNGIFSPGTRLYLWTSTPSEYTGSAQHLYISQFSALMNSMGRDGGQSVRCIKGTNALSTSEVAPKINLGIYPNPTKNIVNIKSDVAIEAVNVITGLGQKLAIPFNNSQISLKELPSGIYIVEVKLKNGQTISKKIIKN